MTRVNVTAGGIQADGYSYASFISGNGRFVSFVSEAASLGDTTGFGQASVKDLVTGELDIVSKTDAGVLGNSYTYQVDFWTTAGS